MRLRFRARLIVLALVAIAAIQLLVGLILVERLREQLGTAQAPEEVVARTRDILAISGVITILAAGLVIAVAVRALSQDVRALVASVERVTAGGGRRALPTSEDTAIAGLAGSFERMAEELDETLRLLASERNRSAAVLDTMDQAVLALDRERRVTIANPAARALLRLDGACEGRRLIEVVRIPAFAELIERVGPGRTSSADLDVPGTPPRHVQVRATGVTDGGAVVVVHDVTEVRRLERVRRDFVANVSHELRTPISVIQANTETLVTGLLDEPTRARPFVDAIMRHADRLGRLVSDLLDISRIEAGKFPLEPGPQAVASAVRHAIDAVAVDARGKRIDVRAGVSDDCVAIADGKALEQVLVNLVGNAVKYTPEGGHVEVSGTRGGGTIRVEVRDDGPGIDPGHRARIFERFYRVDPGRSRDMGGTGLGLSIVKHLIEAMGGQVGVEPRSPRGSVFWFTIAAAPNEPTAPGEPTQGNAD